MSDSCSLVMLIHGRAFQREDLADHLPCFHNTQEIFFLFDVVLSNLRQIKTNIIGKGGNAPGD